MSGTRDTRITGDPDTLHAVWARQLPGMRGPVLSLFLQSAPMATQAGTVTITDQIVMIQSPVPIRAIPTVPEPSGIVSPSGAPQVVDLDAHRRAVRLEVSVKENPEGGTEFGTPDGGVCVPLAEITIRLYATDRDPEPLSMDGIPLPPGIG